MGGIAVAVGGTGLGGTGVAVGGTGVAVGGTAVAVGGASVGVGGTGVDVGSRALAIAPSSSPMLEPALPLAVGVDVASINARGGDGTVFAGVAVVVAVRAGTSVGWLAANCACGAPSSKALAAKAAPRAKTPAAIRKMPMRCGFVAGLLALHASVSVLRA